MFLEELKNAARQFFLLSKEKNIKIISHNDADGICSVAIFVKMLINLGKKFEVRIVKQLTKEIIDELNLQDQLLVLLDLGSGSLNLLGNILEKTNVLVIDHHFPIDFRHFNLLHLNPMLEGISELSACMITYLFAREIDPKNSELVDLATIGVADLEGEFKGTGKMILDEAQASGKVKVEKGIKLYGRYGRPIHKALEYSFDPFIPGISGSESNAVQLLSELGIKIKENEEWRKLSDLSLEEQRKLASAIIIERLRGKENEAAEIFGDNYTMVERPIEIRDAKEFATLLNACGKMDKGHIGVMICLSSIEAIQAALSILEDYRKLIAQYLDLIRSGEIVKITENATYIFAENRIKDTLIGPVISILLNSNFVERTKPIFGFADSDGEVKVSARAAQELEINLRDIVALAASKVNGSGGGHKFAAGALVPKGKEKDFVEFVEAELKSNGNKKD